MTAAYFDNSATSKVNPRVVEAMVPYFLEKYGNASSLHSFGREANEAMELARGQVAKAVGVPPKEMISPPAAPSRTTWRSRALPLPTKGRATTSSPPSWNITPY